MKIGLLFKDSLPDGAHYFSLFEVFSLKMGSKSFKKSNWSHKQIAEHPQSAPFPLVYTKQWTPNQQKNLFGAHFRPKTYNKNKNPRWFFTDRGI